MGPLPSLLGLLAWVSKPGWTPHLRALSPVYDGLKSTIQWSEHLFQGNLLLAYKILEEGPKINDGL